MDVKIEAAAMAAEAEIIAPSVVAVVISDKQAFALISQVASSSCPSIGGTSLSAVAPDHIFEGRTALAAA